MNRRKLLKIALSMTMPGLFLRNAWSADVVRQARTVSGFDRVVVHGVIDLAVTQGDREQLFVTAEARLMPNIVTRVEHRTLIIETSGNLRTEKKLKAELTVRDLIALEAGDSVEVRVERLHAPALHLEISGSAGVMAARLTIESEPACIRFGQCGPGRYDRQPEGAPRRLGRFSGRPARLCRGARCRLGLGERHPESA